MLAHGSSMWQTQAGKSSSWGANEPSAGGIRWLHLLHSPDMCICACQALDFRTHTYTQACSLVAARLALHSASSHTHVWLHFYYKLAISDHFCSFHLSLDCSPFSSWFLVSGSCLLSPDSKGHARRHASDSKSCFRLTFLHIYSYLFVCVHALKTKAILRHLNFLGSALLLTSLQVTYASFLLFYLFILFSRAAHSTHLRGLICIFIDFESIKIQLSFVFATFARYPHKIPIKMSAHK